MKLIVGLGNPGKKYKQTRHNAGFIALDKIGAELGLSFANNPGLKAQLAEANLDGEKILFAKPQTYMNQSGESVSAVARYYKLENKAVLIVHDEADIEFGKIKLSRNSGSAGHRGVESIISHLGKELDRLRIGVDGRENREESPTEEYVLQSFTKEEMKQLQEQIIPEAIEKIEEWIKKNDK